MRFLAALALAFLAFPTAAQAAAPGRVEFQLWRNGHQVGRHTVTVTETPDGLQAATEIAIHIALGPVTLYRYQQSCRETWTGAALTAFNCSTLKDGRRQLVSARRGATQMRVDGAQGERVFPAEAMPTSWWVRPRLSGAMINTDDGTPLPVRIIRVGQETRQIAGQSVAAEHIRVVGTMSVDLWYDLGGHWIGCEFTASGQHFEYRLTSPLANAPSSNG